MIAHQAQLLVALLISLLLFSLLRSNSVNVTMAMPMLHAQLFIILKDYNISTYVYCIVNHG